MLWISAALLGLYVSIPEAGLGAVVAAGRQGAPLGVAAAAGALLGVIAARVARCHLLLGDARPSWRTQVSASGIGFLALQVLPFRLGEWVRPHLLSEAGVPWGRSLAALALERLLDLTALLGMVTLCSVWLPPSA